ncbi:MAG: vitamin B12 dependent-methionine synthase activation domain-containing protein [Victivallaceae bacterium]|nr:vitamin B12 dependent-methionine synthase activation domain-containing protein [Victivallaceae bacterium]
MTQLQAIPFAVSPPVKKIFIRLHTRAKDLNDSERAKVESIIAEAGRLCRPCGIWRFIGAEELPGLTGGSAGVAGFLAGCREAVLFLVTLGPGIVSAARSESAAGNMLRATVFDATGSETAEAAADAFEARLRAEFARGGRALAGRRYSPGYGDWPLEDQRKVFELLGGNPCGVTLSENFFMKPEKTITALIGVARE